MRIRRDGQRFLQDRNSQDFPFIARDPAEAIRTETAHYLWQLDRYAPQMHHCVDTQVRVLKVALQNLLDCLQAHKGES